MPYLIYTSAGTPVTIPDDAIDTTYYNAAGGGGFGPGNTPQAGQGLGTQIIGRNKVDYGAAIAQNFLQLQENFSSSVVPSDAKSLQGQLWFKQTSVTTGDLYVRTTANTTGGILNWSKVMLEGGGAGTGTVTSVGVSGANGIGVASSPVTTSGTIALSLGNITPTTVSTGDVTTSGNIIFSGTNQKITGNLSGSTNSFKFQTNILNGDTILPILPNGTGTTGVIAAWNSSDTANGSFVTIGSTSTGCGLDVGKIGTGALLDLLLSNQTLRGINVTTVGNVVVGGVAALATTATDRFLYLNSMAGVPTGVPTVPTGYTAAGKVPVTVDTTNNLLYFYSSGAWRTFVSASAVNVFTKSQSVASVALTPGASVPVNASLSNNFTLDIGANATFTLQNPTNLTDGMVLNFVLVQDAVGGRVITWGNKFHFPGGSATALLSTAANAVDFVSCYYRASTDKLYCVLNKAFAA